MNDQRLYCLTCQKFGLCCPSLSLVSQTSECSWGSAAFSGLGWTCPFPFSTRLLTTTWLPLGRFLPRRCLLRSRFYYSPLPIWALQCYIIGPLLPSMVVVIEPSALEHLSIGEIINNFANFPTQLQLQVKPSWTVSLSVALSRYMPTGELSLDCA